MRPSEAASSGSAMVGGTGPKRGAGASGEPDALCSPLGQACVALDQSPVVTLPSHSRAVPGARTSKAKSTSNTCLVNAVAPLRLLLGPSVLGVLASVAAALLLLVCRTTVPVAGDQ